MYPLTKCNNCGVTTRSQPEGDGCHACLSGTMERISQPYNKLASAIIFALALTACGSDGDNIQDEAFAFAQTCAVLSASQPKVTYIPDILWPVADPDGVYYEQIEEIIIKESKSNAWDLHVHEYIHHLLYKNEGSPDSCHRSPLFKQCAPSAKTGC